MAAVTGLTVVKRFPYRGDTNEEFSNQYHFRGAPPSDDDAWIFLRDLVVAAERLCFPATVQWVRVTGHNSDDVHAPAVFSSDYDLFPPNPTGSYVPGLSEHPIAGDQAAFVWWLMDYKSTKGKPVYLRKYFHHGFAETSDPDLIGSTGYAQALQTFGATMNTTHGGLRSMARDGTVVNHGHGPHVTTRTLKRRGKKKKTP